MSKIQFRRNSVTTVVPSIGQLINAGEPFVNITDERLFVSKGDGTSFEVGVGGAGLPLPLYTVTNGSTDRAFDANSVTLNELADVVATLITDTQEGLVGPTGATGANGEGVPAGGTAGQVLKKIDGTDYNTEWAADIVDGGTF